MLLLSASPYSVIASVLVRQVLRPFLCRHSATEGDLEQPALFDAMVRARASADGDIVITILGPTTGSRAIQMGKLGRRMLSNMVSNLARVGVHNYLAIASHLHLPAQPDNNLCLSELRPRGICCAWAGVGMRLVAEGTLPAQADRILAAIGI